MEPARNHRSRSVVEAARLHRGRHREETGLTLIEGPILLAEALRAGQLPQVVFAGVEDHETRKLCEEHGLSRVPVDEGALKRLAGTSTPRGPVAVIEIPPPLPVDDAGMIVSWGVGDPGNVGTMIRTAAAFGWNFGLGSGTASPWSPKVLRAGAGAQFRVPMTSFESPGDIADLGFSVVAAVVSGGVAPKSLPPGCYAVLVGDEAHGLPADVAERAAHRVTIPMPGGLESLNAAVASAILMYALTDIAPGNDAAGV